MNETGRSNPGDEIQQDWFFTFGANHTHPVTGERLGGAYVVIHGTCDSTRAAMLDLFGNRWSHHYRTADDAGVERFSLRLVELPPADVPPLDAHSAWVSRSAMALVDPKRGGIDDAIHGSDNADKVRTEILRRFEGPSGGAAARDQWGNADCWCKSPDRPHYRGTGECIVAGLTPASAGGAAALRADGLAALVTLRRYLTDVEYKFLQSEHSAIFGALVKVEARDAAVLEEVKALRREIPKYGAACAIYGGGDVAGAAHSELTARLDRIEQAVRGGGA